LAGILSAAPSVALANLTAIVLMKRSHEAQRQSAGMIVGAIALVVSCALGAVRCVARGSRGRLHGGSQMTAEPLEPTKDEPLASFGPGKLRKVKPGEVGVRFAFGAGVSIVAGFVGLLINPVAGGLFLVFPAILPASLTLIEKKNGPEAAVHDVRGAVLGADAMVAFAIVGAMGFERWPAAVVLAAAAGAWVFVSTAAYVGVAWRERRQSEAPYALRQDELGMGRREVPVAYPRRG
jgi:hypothetical protein